jgi:hypothetical protein
LTAKQIKEWECAKERPKYSDKSEIIGHGAIKAYYGLKDDSGAQKECEDFISPSNFPSEIVKAIKSGKMNYSLPKNHKNLLNDRGNKKYYKVVNPAKAEYYKVVNPAKAEYDKVVNPAKAEYDKVLILYFWKIFADKQNRNNNWR